MNQRIRELWNQSRYPSGRGHDEQKFAELIVKECMNRVRSRQQFAGEDQQNVTQAFDLLVYDLESHFGVEE
jgi:hemerythrin